MSFIFTRAPSLLKTRKPPTQPNHTGLLHTRFLVIHQKIIWHLTCPDFHHRGHQWRNTQQTQQCTSFPVLLRHLPRFMPLQNILELHLLGMHKYTETWEVAAFCEYHRLPRFPKYRLWKMVPSKCLKTADLT